MTEKGFTATFIGGLSVQSKAKFIEKFNKLDCKQLTVIESKASVGTNRLPHRKGELKLKISNSLVEL